MVKKGATFGLAGGERYTLSLYLKGGSLRETKHKHRRLFQQKVLKKGDLRNVRAAARFFACESWEPGGFLRNRDSVDFLERSHVFEQGKVLAKLAGCPKDAKKTKWSHLAKNSSGYRSSAPGLISRQTLLPKEN